MNILGIETSCDETAAAVVRDGGDVLSNIISSQIELHRPYGGVVPELASRNHLKLIDHVVAEALDRAGLTMEAVDAVAATYGPGLASSLLIGLNAAKGIALAAGKPFLAINHLEAHLYSPFLAMRSDATTRRPSPSELFPTATSRELRSPTAPPNEFPMVSLIVSGGHTILVHVLGMGRFKILGQTLDDAAGEAFDKVAKLLKLGYPGGPAIERLAREGNSRAIAFPRGLLRDPGFDFSFSGLKTSVMYYLRQHPDAPVADVCASFQEAVVDVLVAKLVRAAEETTTRQLSVSGGVSLNRQLRERLQAECTRRGWRLLLAPAGLCTDNAAMIAALAFHKWGGKSGGDFAVDVAPSCGLEVNT